ncbi:MAG: WecB/TagA/CpsF family glycosyltransferase [Terracidiphilus sp.]|jgi:N-acetylglucosaminyldiphosphoundecaprenol N-acetyl-beta-D-mannosaminyltransferase
MASAHHIPTDAVDAVRATAEARWEPAPRLDIGSIAVDKYSQAALIDDALHHALYGKSTRQVVTANAQFYVLAQKSRRFRECIRRAHYICADGMPIVWACSTLYGEHVPRIAGVSLIEKLCRLGSAHGLRLFLLGGKPGAADLTASILKKQYAGIRIAGTNCPPYGFERNEESLHQVLDHISAAKPHAIFVGLGAPKQEFFIRDHVRRLNVPLAIGIGGSFEILSGKLKRAPAWMQSSGLEWAYRLSQEPSRLWKRYLIGNAEFLWHILKARLTGASRNEIDTAFGSAWNLHADGEGR